MVKKFFPNRQFKAFLFDFDGTVADTMPAHLKAWNEALGLYGLTLSSEQHQEWAGRPTREILRLLCERHQIEIHPEDFFKSKESYYLSSIVNVKGIIPIVELIEASYGKVPMALVSGSRRKPIETTLQHLNMTHFFPLIVAAEDYTHGKPAPDCFLKAAKILGVSPEDCLVFEDAELGIQAAHAAGMACLKVVENAELGHEVQMISRRHET